MDVKCVLLVSTVLIQYFFKHLYLIGTRNKYYGCKMCTFSKYCTYSVLFQTLYLIGTRNKYYGCKMCTFSKYCTYSVLFQTLYLIGTRNKYYGSKMWPVISKGTLRVPLTKSRFWFAFQEEIPSFIMIPCLWTLNKYSWKYHWKFNCFSYYFHYILPTYFACISIWTLPTLRYLLIWWVTNVYF